MSRYLQRLVARSSVDAAPGAARPLVVRTSPIADEDQRIGMPGFEDFRFGIDSSARSEPEETIRATDNPGSYAQPRIGEGKADTGTPQTRAAGPGGLPAPGPAARPSFDESSPTVSVSFDSRASDRSAARGAPGDEKVISPLDQIIDREHTRPPRDSQDEIAPNTVRQARANAGDLGTSRATSSVREETVGSRHRRATEAIPPLLDPSPRAITSEQQIESISARVAGPARKNEQAPRVVIGRINVEIVPPPAEQKSSAARPGPLTAESVSVIGPLRKGSHSNLRLSLRHR